MSFMGPVRSEFEKLPVVDGLELLGDERSIIATADLGAAEVCLVKGVNGYSVIVTSASGQAVELPSDFLALLR